MAKTQEMWRREQERKRRERQRRLKRQRLCALTVVLCAVIAIFVIISATTKDNETPKPTDAPVFYTKAPDNNRDAAENVYTTTLGVEDIKMSFYSDCAFAGNALAKTIGMYNIIDGADCYAHINADVSNVYTLTPQSSTTSIVDQFKSKKFKKIFLCFGEKELEMGNSSQFRVDYEDLIEKIKEYQPNVGIYLIGIPPVTANVSENGDSGITMSRIKSYNRKIMELSKAEDVYYIDSIDALGDNKGFLPDGVSADGINLNRAAVIDLLYYGAKKAYIPTQADLNKLDDEEEEEEEVRATNKPSQDKKDEDEDEKSSKNSKSTPSPSVNVLKDSEIKKSEKE